MSSAGGVVMRANRQGSTYRWGVGVVVLAMGLVIAAVPPSSSAQATPRSVQDSFIPLEYGIDFVTDGTAGLTYVSDRGARVVLVVDLATAEVIEEFSIDGFPTGLELSADGSELFVALFKKGKVLVLDAATGAPRRSYAIAEELNERSTWDLERIGKKLYVVASSGYKADGEYGRLVEIDLTSGVARRLIEDQPIYNRPRLAWDGGRYLYVGDYDHLRKLDLLDPDVPLVLSGYVRPPGFRYVVNATQLLTGSGRSLDPDNFGVVLGRTAAGFPAFSDDQSRLFVAELGSSGPVQIIRFDALTLERGPAFVTSCIPGGNVGGFEVLDGDAGFLVIGLDGFCIASRLPARFGTCDGQEPTIVGSHRDDTIVGTEGSDVIVGLGGNDTILADAGDDVICGGAGDDAMSGQAGNDWLRGDAGNDVLRGGPGDDLLRGANGTDTASYQWATAGVNVDLTAGSAAGEGTDALYSIERLIGSGWDDTLVGNGGSNEIDGGRGDDVLRGGGGNDLLLGRIGNDHLAGNGGDDVLRGGAGDDELSGGFGVDTLFGGGGDFHDTVTFLYSPGPVEVALAKGQAGAPLFDTFRDMRNVVGSQFNDTIVGDGEANVLVGGGGGDVIEGKRGNDLLLGGAGNDLLLGGDGIDTILGQGGENLIDGGGDIDAGSYELAGSPVTASLLNARGTGDGNDSFVRIEALIGSTGGDSLEGDGRFNILIGLDGKDVLRGGGGPDDLYGDEANDKLYGEEGEDYLDGGDGFDKLYGGAHIDRCYQGEVLDSCEGILGVNGVVSVLQHQRAVWYRAWFTNRVANSRMASSLAE